MCVFNVKIIDNYYYVNCYRQQVCYFQSILRLKSKNKILARLYFLYFILVPHILYVCLRL